MGGTLCNVREEQREGEMKGERERRGEGGRGRMKHNKGL